MTDSTERGEFEARIDELLSDYEFRGDDGGYTPSENELCLIKDFVMGLPDELNTRPAPQQQEVVEAARVVGLCYHGEPLNGECAGCRAYVDALFREGDPSATDRLFGPNPLVHNDIMTLAGAVCKMHDYDEMQPQCVIALRKALADHDSQQAESETPHDLATCKCAVCEYMRDPSNPDKQLPVDNSVLYGETAPQPADEASKP